MCDLRVSGMCMLWCEKGKLLKERKILCPTKLYMCLIDDQGVVRKGENAEENEDVMPKTSVIFTKLYMCHR
jgi:hypothetical protein